MELQTTQDRKKLISNEYELFVHEFELRYPPPAHNIHKKRWMLRLLLGASVIASARHNIPFFVGQVDSGIEHFAIALVYALSVVVMVEVALVLLGELIVDDFGDLILTIRPGLAVMAIVLLLLVAIGSNVTDGFEGKGLYIHDNVKTAINALANITAPMMALIIGIMYASLDAKFADIQESYQRKKNNAWQKHKRDIEMSIGVSKPTDKPTDIIDNTPRLSASMSSQTDNRQASGAGYTKSSTAVDNAKAWLLDNPDMMNKPLRELAVIVPGAGKDSINKARKLIRQTDNLNGNSSDERNTDAQ